MTGASRPSVRVGKRALAALAAGSIAVPLSFGMMGGTAFAATAPPPTDIQGICPTGQVPDSSFPDTQNDFFKDAINCLVAYGVTQGYPDGTYKPSLDVNREQMALFFYRVGKAAGFSWNTSDAGFKDINTASSQEAKDAINALANAGIVQGFTDGTYRPANVVQRDAMAKYIANTVKTLGGPDMTNSTNDYFVDDEGNTFENYINGIAQGTITNGIDATHYGPGLSVHRDAMAGFITRSMEVLYKAGKLKTQFPQQTSNQTYTVSPSSNQAVQPNSNTQFSVSGLGTTPVNIELFNCKNVTTSSTGQTTFTGSNPGGTGNVAVPGTVSNESISVVNGATSAGGQLIQNVTPSNGTVTFTVTNNGPAGDCFVPVVFSNADSNQYLELNTSNVPTEAFGIGGQNTVVPAQAPAGGVVTTGGVTSAGSTFFVQNGTSYYYTSADQYQLVKPTTTGASCQPSTYAEFQSRLTQGDSVSGTYVQQPSTSGQHSTFCLNDIAPPPPTMNANATNNTNGGVTVSWTNSTANESTSNITGYTIYRAAAIPPAITGAPYTCPPAQPTWNTASPQTTPPTVNSAWTAVATALPAQPTTSQQTTTYSYLSGTYTYKDTTASAGSSTTNPNQYCYSVSSVSPNGAGATQTGTGSTAQGPTAAGAAATNPSTLVFTKAAQATANTVTVTYNQGIDCKTVDGSAAWAAVPGNTNPPSAYDFTVQSSTTQNPAVGVSTAQPISAITNCDNLGSYTSGGNTINNVGEVTIQVAGTNGGSFPADQYIVVTAKVGTDGNTVANSSDTANQAAGDQVVTSSATTAPTIASVTQDTAANTLDFTYNEPVKCGDGTVAAAANYKISTDTGSTCQNVTMSGNTGTAATAGSTNVIQVTFASAFTPGSYSVTYTKPGSPTTTNATYDPVNGLFAPSQTVTGVTVS